MHTFLKTSAIAATVLAAATMAATPSQARWRAGDAAAAGFVGGAVVGAAVASNYYGGPAYYDGPGYYAAPGYGGPYAYEPAPVYAQPGPGYVVNSGSCWHPTDESRGFGYYGACATPRLDSAARAQRNKYGN